jgi:hypothetical protein
MHTTTEDTTNVHIFSLYAHRPFVKRNWVNEAPRHRLVLDTKPHPIYLQVSHEPSPDPSLSPLLSAL